MRPELPTGVVTLLFTDIETSTQLLAELRTAYVEVLAHHREVLRAACERHDGVVVDSQGDAMLMAFGHPAAAVRAAAEGQLALADGPVRVRMGLHSGTPEIHDGAYVGLDVHRGARIGAAGHGGQVLLSSTTQALIDAPAEDLGLHQLRGLEEPEHIYQLSIEGLPDRFAPLTTIEAERPDLPSWATSFVGRDVELQRIADLLDDPGCHIVSIVGPGGAGKTRLAVEAARGSWEQHPRRTVFAALVSVETEEQLVVALADALGLAIDLAHSAGRGAEEQLLDFVRERSVLIVADNCEQLLPAAGLFGRIVEAAPGVRLLVTTRSRLDLAGEWTVDVAGLTGSTDGGQATRLFVERARQRDPGLSLRDDDWAAVERVCQLTEAMPLAIELAAAWIGVLSPAELADELARDLDMLSSRSNDAPQRHRSLRAAFDSSWRLLDEEQRRVLASLSVFEGPFTREMAEAVAGASLMTLAELVTRSLVRRADDRYEMHELIHRYAAEALEARGDAGAVREAHARAFVERVTARRERLQAAASPAARAELRPDVADIRAAAVWAVTHWQSHEVAPLLQALTIMWVAQVDPAGPPVMRELARVIDDERDRALDAGVAAPMRTKLAGFLAVSLASVDANHESDVVVDEYLDRVRETGDRWDIATCLLARGMNRDNRDENAEAIAPLEEADALYAELGDDLMRCDTLTWLGWAHLMLGHVETAQGIFEEAQRLALAVGDPVTVAFTVSKLGTLDDAEGRPADALRRHLDAFASFDAAGNTGGVGFSLSRAGLSAYMLGDYRASLDFTTAAFEAFDSLGHSWGSSIAAERMAFAFLGLDRPAAAREWGLKGLQLVSDGAHARLGRLSSLAAIAAAGIRQGGRDEWLPVLRTIVADPDMPAMYAMQARHQLTLAEDAGSSSGTPEPEGAAPDLDGVIDRLLRGTATRV